MKRKNLLLSITLLIVTLFLSGCGGDGGGAAPVSTVSGVAAAGAPIIGSAYLKDKNGTTIGPTPIDSAGNFSFVVTNLVPPFILKAEGAAGGQSYTIYSAAMGSGTANINPFTNLAIAAAAGKDPSQVFGTPGSAPDVTKMTNTDLQTAINQIKTMLQPLLTNFGVTTFDPVSGGYVANSSNPLDAMLDMVKVQVTPTGTVNVINKLDNSTITTGAVTDIAAMPQASANMPPASVLTEIEEIKNRLVTWAGTMNKGAALTASDLDPFYISDPLFGVNNGKSRTMEIDDMVTSFSGGDLSPLGGVSTLRNFGIAGDLTSSYGGRGVSKVYAINVDFVFSGGNFGSPTNMVIAKETSSGLWKFIGNGDLLECEIRATAFKWIRTDGTSLTKTGLMCNLEDIGNRGIQSAVITGPGLGAGVTLSKDITSLHLDPPYQDTSIPTNNLSFKPLTDAEISAIPDNAGYTIILKNNAGVTVGQIMRSMPRRPLLGTEITDAHFPTFTAQGFTLTHSFATTTNLLGQTAKFTYATSPLYTTAWLTGTYELADFNLPGALISGDKNLRVNATSASISVMQPQPAFIPNSGFVRIDADDENKRSYRYVWMIGP